MTKFVPTAIGHRQGKSGKGGGEKARQQELEEFLKTGVHPEQRAAQASALDAPLPLPPPDPDGRRPRVALDFALDGRALGRAVVEVFEDSVPLAAGQLLRRCATGSAEPLAGARATRLVRLSAVEFGAAASSSSASASASARPALDTNAAARRTRFSAAGVVGVARDGSGAVALSLGRAAPLDATHLVVGRVCRWIAGGGGAAAADAAAAAAAAAAEAASGGAAGAASSSPTTEEERAGAAFAAALNTVRTNPVGDAPRGRLAVARCGRSDARGELVAADAAGGAAARPPPTAKEVRAGVQEALEQGLQLKRKGPEAGGGGAAAGGAAAAPRPAAKRRTMMDALSGSGSESSSSDDDDDDDEEEGGGG